MNRPRRNDRKHWPNNLIARTKGGAPYYSWRHPTTGKEYGLGRSFQDAASQAREANLSLMAEATNKARLIDRIAGRDEHTISAWLDIFAKTIEARPSAKKGGGSRAEGTRKVDARMIKVMRDHFKDALIEKISTRDCHDLIMKYRDAGHERAAVNIRSYLVDCFNEAEAAGWIPRGTNPANIIKTNPPRTKRNRLTLAQFNTVLEHAEGWARTAFLLALITGQRVSDIAVMKYSDVQGGFLFVQQIKYGNRIKIPVSITADGHSLATVIKQSRRIVGAPTIVHQTESTGRSNPGAALRKESISREFSRLVREHLPAFTEGTPPTFHEIRALSKQLHTENGIDTLALLGHEDEATAKVYSDPRAGWVEVKIPRSA